MPSGKRSRRGYRTTGFGFFTRSGTGVGWLDRWRPASCIVWGERLKKVLHPPSTFFRLLGKGGQNFLAFSSLPRSRMQGRPRNWTEGKLRVPRWAEEGQQRVKTLVHSKAREADVSHDLEFRPCTQQYTVDATLRSRRLPLPDWTVPPC